MSSDHKFDLEYQFKLYLSLTGLEEQKAPEWMIRELKRAFFGSAGQLLVILRDDMAKYTDVEAVEFMVKMEDQVGDFFLNEVAEDMISEENLIRKAKLN